jgi:hypothetical protein
MTYSYLRFDTAGYAPEPETAETACRSLQWNWDRLSGQQKSDIYEWLHVPVTGWRGKYFLPLTTGVTTVASHMITLAVAQTNHKMAISNCTICMICAVDSLVVCHWMVLLKTRPFVTLNNAEFTNVSSLFFLVFAILKCFDIYRIHKCVSLKHNNLFHVH